MLVTVRSMRDMDFPALIEIYAEGNRENAEERWPEEPAGRRLQLQEESFRDYLRDVFFATAQSVYYIWTENGQWVSALRLEPYRDGWLLEALETAPAFRRRGYASVLIREVASRTEGPLYSHVHKRNEASLTVHKRGGFRRISEIAVYIDGSVNDRCCTLRREGAGVCEI